MRYGLIVAMAVMLLARAALADNLPVKTFIPLPASYKNSQGNTELAPHFFPLRSRPIGKIMPHVSNAAAQNDEIPAARAGKPEVMTGEQAQQILLLFGE